MPAVIGEGAPRLDLEVASRRSRSAPRGSSPARRPRGGARRPRSGRSGRCRGARASPARATSGRCPSATTLVVMPRRKRVRDLRRGSRPSARRPTPSAKSSMCLRLTFCLVERGVAGVERDVDVDAAAAHADAADRLRRWPPCRRPGPSGTLQLHGRVDVLDAEQIARAEQRRRARRGLVGELELGVARRPSAPIEPEMSMPMTSARLARRRSCLRSNETGETSSMRRPRVAAGAHAPVAAHEDEAAAEVAHVARRARRSARARGRRRGCRRGPPRRSRRGRRGRRARAVAPPWSTRNAALLQGARAMNAPLPGVALEHQRRRPCPRTRTNALPALSSGRSSSRGSSAVTSTS